MDAYISRVRVIRQRMRAVGLTVPLKLDIYTVLTAIKTSHPEIYDRSMTKLEKNDLTWEDFIKD